jgi:hypothetical protein
MSHIVRNQRRGNYAAFFGISCLVLLGFTAIGIDSGWQRIAMTQLHNAADAGAHAGAMQLDGTLEGIERAVERAIDVTNANLVHGYSVAIDTTTAVSNDGVPSNTDITVARFDAKGENGCLLDGGCWTEIGAAPSTADYEPDLESGTVDFQQVNALQVDAEAQVSTFFGGVAFGTTELGAYNYSVGRMPIYQGTECAFPFSIGDCTLQDFMSGTTAAGDPGAPSPACGKVLRLRLSSSNDDNAAAAVPDTMGSANASTMRDMIANEADCPSDVAWDEILDGLTVNFNNGALSNIIQQINTSLNQDGVAWDPNWGDCSVATCDIANQGLCQGGGITGTYESEALCTAAGGTWNTTCPVGNGNQLSLPRCNNGKFLRRDVLVFDMTELGTNPCSSNGNPSASLGNYSGSASVEGISTLIIYNVEIQRGSSKCGTGSNPACDPSWNCSGNPRNHDPECYVPNGVWMDVYLSCTNEDGEWTTDVVHNGTSTFLDDDQNTVALVR